MSENENFLPWEAANWIEEMSAWISHKLAAQHLDLLDKPFLVHSAPWSGGLWRTDQAKGKYYFKALCPVLMYEPLLTKQLSIWQPDTSNPCWKLILAVGGC